MPDHSVRIMSSDGFLRASAAVTTDLTRAICRLQGCDPTASIALARLVVGAALLGSQLKGDQRLALQIEGNGPLQRLQAESDAGGHLRASVKNPLCGLPPKDGRFDVAGAIGRAGFLHVVKDLGLKEPYRGMVQLQSSEIGEDLAWYLLTSEQIPSTVAVGAVLDPAGEVAAAGGVLVQAMPGADPSLVPLLEERLLSLPPISTSLRDGHTPIGLLDRLFAGIPYGEQGQRQALSFHCGCSRAQAGRILLTLGREELQELAGKAEGTVVTCEYCRATYGFDGAALAALAAGPGTGN
ncbi:MAG TPA: Hsp33 family molecular chaperone HslO [Desulfuromonas sp.]|nr:Hsp33 family molecular chaperone HslO [Desulfuromonas sp.]